MSGNARVAVFHGISRERGPCRDEREARRALTKVATAGRPAPMQLAVPKALNRIPDELLQQAIEEFR